ncbi:unnamed protein product, partial [Prorocentrum cordatum]
MRDQHGLTEPRDALDCAEGLLGEASAAAERAQGLLHEWRAGRASDTAALFSLLPVREKLLLPRGGGGDGQEASPPRDPALALFFDALAEAASAAGVPELAVSSWERALELVTAREPFSYRGAMIAARLAIEARRAAAEAAAPLGDEPEAGAATPVPELAAAADHWLQASREHWRVVFGTGAGSREDLFEARNPGLCQGSASL